MKIKECLPTTTPFWLAFVTFLFICLRPLLSLAQGLTLLGSPSQRAEAHQMLMTSGLFAEVNVYGGEYEGTAFQFPVNRWTQLTNSLAKLRPSVAVLVCPLSEENTKAAENKPVLVPEAWLRSDANASLVEVRCFHANGKTSKGFLEASRLKPVRGTKVYPISRAIKDMIAAPSDDFCNSRPFRISLYMDGEYRMVHVTRRQFDDMFSWADKRYLESLKAPPERPTSLILLLGAVLVIAVGIHIVRRYIRTKQSLAERAKETAV
jgi:hypothetical protein